MKVNLSVYYMRSTGHQITGLLIALGFIKVLGIAKARTY